MSLEFDYLPIDTQKYLSEVAKKLVLPGKGFLTCDDSEELLGKRLEVVGVKNTDENRRLYREILFTTEPKIREHISGVILNENNLYDYSGFGISFPELMRERGLSYGVTVHRYLTTISNSDDEYTTVGLDDLASRCTQLKKLGCEFLNWRCMVQIDSSINGDDKPSIRAITENATILARYAYIAQLSNLVPIVETEVLPYGNHNLEHCQRVTETNLSAVIKALQDYHVFLEGILIKPNMVNGGQNCLEKYSSEEVALATTKTIWRCIPPAVPGILFVTGGASEENASLYLNEINKVDLKRKPWSLTFAYNRALQESVLQCWRGKRKNVLKAQTELLKRARANGLAAKGKYIPGSIPTYMAAQLLLEKKL